MMFARNGGKTEEHENGGLAALCQHFDEIFDGLIGIMR
jgi:hypothetical protein